MEEFKGRGYEVYVVACANNEDDIGYAVEGGLHVIRAKVPEHQNVGNIKKGLAILTMPYAYQRAIKKHLPKSIEFDLIIMPTPPISLASLAARLKKRYKAPVYLILRDIFPQNAVDLGFMSDGGIMHRFFRRMERKLYATANKIGCMSPGNIAYVKAHNPEVDPNKLHLLPNWQAPHNFDRSQRVALKKEMGLTGKFLLFFGGNLGKPQRVENLVELAKSLSHRSEVLIYVVGRGTEAAKLQQLIAQANIDNILVKDFVPRKTYFKLMQMADVGLISLDERFTIPNLPSKSLTYFNAGIPVVAVIDPVTDFGTWLEDEIGAGFWTTRDKIEVAANKIEMLIDQPEMAKELGERGYTYYMENLLPEHTYATITEQVQ